MKPEQQRIAIAEACGWTLCEYVESIGLAKGRPGNNTPSYGTYENGMAQLPNYCNDLNAMHEAEKTLNQNLAAEYARMLTSTAWKSEQPTFAPMTATASQRAEAFLRTIEKWEEKL
jgi:hypothetical protein